MKFKKAKRALLGIAVLVILGLGFIAACNLIVYVQAKDSVITNIEDVQFCETALVLGTAKVTKNGLLNLYFKGRMEAADLLYKSGKVSKLLVSGDNHTRGYDEPTDMQESLVDLGVPVDDIILDYAGFRTLDSVIRAKEVFGLSKCVIVTQKFHAYRSAFIAKSHGLDAVVFCAEDVRLARKKNNLRESLARVRAVLDVYVFKTEPKFCKGK